MIRGTLILPRDLSRRNPRLQRTLKGSLMTRGQQGLLAGAAALWWYMKQNPIEQGRFSEHAHGLGTVTPAMIRQRAKELALINGRPNHVLDSDLAQARHELTGEERLNPEQSAAEQLPEESRWEEVPESVGHKAPTVAAPDEQTFAEELVEEGIEDAEQDQMVRATRESLKRENRR